MATLVCEIKLSVIVSLDGDAGPITREIAAENALAWLRTLDDAGELAGAVDSWTIIDSYEEG